VGDAFRDKLKDGTEGPEVVLLPAGRFDMGDLVGVSDHYSENARPVRPVTIRAPFAMGKYEVTYDEFDRFTAATGRAQQSDQGWGRGRRPVVKVTWEDALAYVQWLSEQTGKRYRIPSEAEWEYAARGGTRTHYWWGNQPSHEHANYGKGVPGWFPDGVVSGKDQWMFTAPVGQFAANPFGLHDMHGNAWEWVADCYADGYEGAPADGSARGGDCENRVMRGGSFGYNPGFMRSSARIKVFWGVLSFLNYGIRVVREVD
jgi:formylglycine-generating enzyme required for sulfatase activity